MSLKVFQSLLLLAIALVGSVRAVYDFRIETFRKVKGDTVTLFDFNLRLIGRQRLLNGTIINHEDLDDTYEIVAHIEAFVNGKWKPSNIAGRFKPCFFMRSIFVKYWAPSLKDSNVPSGKEACPFKKGEYYLRNVQLNSENWPGYARQGLNKVECILMKNNITYGGFIGTGTLIERPT